MAVKAIPDGYYSLTPYLVIKGAAEAIEFYKKVFGAVEIGSHARARRPHHARRDQDRQFDADALGRKPRARLSVAEIARRHDLVSDALHRRCGCDVQEGGGRRREDRTAADRHVLGRSHGEHPDPFGHNWAIATHKEDVSGEEMEKRMQMQGA